MAGFRLLAAMLLASSSAWAEDGFVWQTTVATQHAWRQVSTPEPVRAGTVSQRFEARPGDCGPDPNDASFNDCDVDRERVELVSNQHFAMDSERWLAFSVFIPRRFEDPTPVRTILAQVGQRGDSDNFPSRPPLMQFIIENGRFLMTHHRLRVDGDHLTESEQQLQLQTLSNMRGHWTDVMLHVRFSSTTGLAEAFLNGTSKAKIQGQLVSVTAHHFMMKYGIYRPFVSKYSRLTGQTMPTQIVYFDEICIGAARQDVDVRSHADPVD